MAFSFFFFFAHPQTNPNIDKKVFNEQSLIGLKGEGRSFPISQDIPILKWRLHNTDDELIPLFSKFSLLFLEIQ